MSNPTPLTLEERQELQAICDEYTNSLDAMKEAQDCPLGKSMEPPIERFTHAKAKLRASVDKSLPRALATITALEERVKAAEKALDQATRNMKVTHVGVVWVNDITGAWEPMQIDLQVSPEIAAYLKARAALTPGEKENG